MKLGNNEHPKDKFRTKVIECVMKRTITFKNDREFKKKLVPFKPLLKNPKVYLELELKKI